MKVFLLRFGELFLKGGNKKIFEAALEKDIKKKLESIPLEFKKTQGRYIIANFEDKFTSEINKQTKIPISIYPTVIFDFFSKTNSIRKIGTATHINNK